MTKGRAASLPRFRRGTRERHRMDERQVAGDVRAQRGQGLLLGGVSGPAVRAMTEVRPVFGCAASVRVSGASSVAAWAACGGSAEGGEDAGGPEGHRVCV